jgi:hypothetical protein
LIEILLEIDPFRGTGRLYLSGVTSCRFAVDKPE